jgi:hypothetical protein
MIASPISNLQWRNFKLNVAFELHNITWRCGVEQTKFEKKNHPVSTKFLTCYFFKKQRSNCCSIGGMNCKIAESRC